jgi:hypothetical protein
MGFVTCKFIVFDLRCYVNDLELGQTRVVDLFENFIVPRSVGEYSVDAQCIHS